MRPFRWLSLAAALAAAPLLAQEATDPPPGGLSDLADTVRDLDDATPQEEEPAPAAEPAPEPVVEVPSAPAVAPPLTVAQTEALAAAAQRGQQLAAIARAGLIATQDMLSRVADPEAAGLVGWIAVPEGNATQVTFYARGEGEGARVAAYRANILGGRVVSRDSFAVADRPALGPIEARMAAARDATDGLDVQACGSQPFNVLVIPPASARAAVEVYQVSASAQRGRYPLGGHFRSTVAGDGTVTETHGFAEGCADIEVPEAVAGQPPRPVVVRQPLDALPDEMHVFLAQWAGRPLLVAVRDPRRVFLVGGDRIAEVRDAPAE